MKRSLAQATLSDMQASAKRSAKTDLTVPAFEGDPVFAKAFEWAFVFVNNVICSLGTHEQSSFRKIINH